MQKRELGSYVPRRPRRHSIRLACQVVRERDFSLVGEELVELSECGLLVVPQQRVLTGESLLVSFMAPFTRQFVDAEAVVSRVVHGRRLGDAGPLLGVSLTGMDRLSRALLASQLPWLDSVRPRAPLPS